MMYRIPKLFPLCRIQPQVRQVSDLGLRSHHPPDSISPRPTPNNNNNNNNDIDDSSLTISDSEWEIRTGRIILVLQRTLPHFFQTGLVTSTDVFSGTPDDPPSSASTISSALKSQIFSNPHSFESSLTESVKQGHESIYSSRVRLSYTPPIALPAPFPKTLRIEGFPLYIASSTFVKHTLRALYADLRVDIIKFIVYTPCRNHPLPPEFFSGSLSGRDVTQSQAKDVPLMGPAPDDYGQNNDDVAQRRRSDGEVFDLHDQNGKQRAVMREKSLLVGFKVSGRTRVSNTANEWDVTSTYTFSPLSGLIHTHVIDSIHPAPHQAVYDSLRSSLGNVFGWGMTERGAPSPANVQGKLHPVTTGAAAYRTTREHDRGDKEK